MPERDSAGNTYYTKQELLDFAKKNITQVAVPMSEPQLSELAKAKAAQDANNDKNGNIDGEAQTDNSVKTLKVTVDSQQVLDLLKDKQNLQSEIEALRANQQGNAQGGQAPLSREQYGIPQQHQTFSSQKELIEHLYANKSDPNSKAVLDALWKKALDGQKQNGQGFASLEISSSDLMEKIRKPRKVTQQ